MLPPAPALEVRMTLVGSRVKTAFTVVLPVMFVAVWLNDCGFGFGSVTGAPFTVSEERMAPSPASIT